MLRNLSDWVVGTARIVNRITGLKTIARRRSVRPWNVECLEVRSMLSHILGTAESFAVLGGQSVTNTGPSVISGNLGVSPGSSVTGFPPGLVINGTMHVTDAVAGQAQSDLTTAYNVVAGTAITADLTGQDLGGLTLTPGVYFFSTSAQLTGTLTLDSQGNPNAQFFFQIGSTLTTASNSTVMMLNNGSPCEVFWQIGSSATLGTDTQFVGHILALTSITLNSRASVEGSVLARNGSVTLDDNFVSKATCVPGSISGMKFNDLNGDGIQQGGESGLPGLTVFLDYNGNGLLDAGEDSATTDAGGNYTFADLNAGTYRVRQTPQAGLVQTTSNPADIVLPPGGDVTGVDFGDFQRISISGSKFRDTDGDGVRDPGELGLAGVTIFVDADNDGVLDLGESSTTTDANGNYSFTNLGPGTYRIREVPPVSFTQTTPNPPPVVASSGTNITGQLFGNFQSGNFQNITIGGAKFGDTDGDGVRDPGELGQAGVTIFLDADNDGVLDLGESFTTTDANGSFTFTNLGPGTYSVREVLPVGTVQTTVNPAPVVASSGVNVTGQQFGNFQRISINGSKFQDTDGDGVRDPGELGLAGVTIFIDADNDGVRDLGETFTTTDASGNYTFTNLGPGTYNVREVLPANSVQTTSNPSTVAATSGANITGQLFGNFQRFSINGTKFRDTDGDGVRDPGELGQAGVTIFIDADNDGVRDLGETFTTTDANGNYSFTNLGPGTYNVREEVPVGSVQTTSNPTPIVASSGANITGQLFGNFQLITINGSKFQDSNGNGVRDPGDVGLAGFVIFLDTDNDGVLDLGEQSTTSDTNGNFRFTSVGLGTYRVREVGKLDFVQMTNNPSVVIVTTSGANVTGLLFGNIPVANLVVISKLLFTGQNLINLRNGTFARQANFVASLYQALLGRAPDLAGLRKYLRLLQSGFSQTRVIAIFRADFRV